MLEGNFAVLVSGTTASAVQSAWNPKPHYASGQEHGCERYPNSMLPVGHFNVRWATMLPIAQPAEP